MNGRIYDLRFAIDAPARVGLVLAWVLVGLSLARGFAHDSPEHVAEELTALLQRGGRSAELLLQRATQYRELGRLAEAEADLRAALEVEPSSLGPANDLARVQLHRGHAAEALATLDRALDRSPADARAPLLLTRAEIRAAQGDFRTALADCDRAFASTEAPELDWHLLRSQLQLRAGKFAEAATGLQKAFEQTGSAVLEAEWIDAMLDAGQAKAALERVEGPLADARWRSSWLIRRARARLVLNDRTRARGDLHAALTELNERLHPTRPDPSLLLDRGLAHSLLGDAAAAGADLAAARAAGAEPGSAWRLESRLVAHP